MAGYVKYTCFWGEGSPHPPSPFPLKGQSPRGEGVFGEGEAELLIVQKQVRRNGYFDYAQHKFSRPNR